MRVSGRQQEFDERYPAMFQPGGEDVPANLHWPVQPENTRTTTQSLPAPSPEPQHTEVETAVPATPAIAETELPGSTLAEATLPAKSSWTLWYLPVIVGGLLLAIGALSLIIPWWISTMGDDPNTAFEMQMWMYSLAQLVGPLMGVGIGVLAALLFLFTQQHPTRREGLRRLFTIAAAAVLAVGLFAQFANFLIPPDRQEVVGSAEGTTEYYFIQPNVVTALTMVAFPVVLVGVLMFAALAISRNFSALRMNCVGLLLLAAAAFSFFAQTIFPDIPWISDESELGVQGIPGWPSWLPQLTPVLVTAGLLTIATAMLLPVASAAFTKVGNTPKQGHPALVIDAVDH